jgi:RHS repeat-associated protein
LDGSTGQPAQYYRYTCYGETTPYGHLSNPWQFASKRFDPLTGFHRFGKRDYDCSLGRWLTPDPAGFTDGPNLYAYVHNSPLILFDPWGLQGQDLYDRNKAGVSTGIRRSSSGTNPSNQSSDTIGTRPGCWSNGSNMSCNPWLSGIKGAAHGCCDCILDTGLFLSSCLCEAGCNDFDLDCYERAELRDVIADQQAMQKARFDGWMQSTLSVNPNDAVKPLTSPCK